MTIVTLIVLALNITSLPVIMTMLNVVIAVTSFTSLITIVSFIIGKLPKNNNNNKFIKSYENFQDILENYRLDNYKDKQNDLVKTNAKTEFTEITPIEQNYNLTEIKSKIKSKIKEHE